MNETMHGPTVVAALIRAAYEEGRLCPRDPAVTAEQWWQSSKAKAAAAQIVQNAGDPTLVERFFGLFRAWSNSGDYKKACALMREMRELVGPAPFDGGAQ